MDGNSRADMGHMSHMACDPLTQQTGQKRSVIKQALNNASAVLLNLQRVWFNNNCHIGVTYFTEHDTAVYNCI